MRVTYLRARLVILKGIILSLPFGGIKLTPLPYTSAVFMLIYLYLLTCLLSVVRNQGVIKAPPIAFLPLALWIVFAVSTYVSFEPDAEVAGSNLRQILFFSVFFLFAVSDVQRLFLEGDSPLKYFTLACLGMGMAFIIEFGPQYASDSRLTLEYLNPNALAMYSVIGFITIFDAYVRSARDNVFGKMYPFSLPICAVFLLMIGLSGSRGGLLILGASVLVYYAGMPAVKTRHLPSLIVFGILSVAAIWQLATQDMMSQRLLEINEDIRLTKLWPTGLEIFSSHPLIGAGFAKTEVLMTEVFGQQIALHNEFLKIATAGGSIGLLIFGVFTFLLLQRALAWRKEANTALFVTLLVIVLLFLGKGGGALQKPFVWVVFAILAAYPPGYYARRRAVLSVPAPGWSTTR